MDLEERLRLLKGIAIEVITEKDLRTLLETKEEPVAYDGFEPSGIANLPLAIYRPLLLRDIVKAGVRFKILLADSYGWINNKLGGDIEKIREAAQYFIEVWKVAGRQFGLDFSKVEFLWHKDYFDDPEYWKKVILIAKAHTLKRTKRALTIAGRVGAEEQPTAFFFYPSMQAADIFHMKADITQLGLDQRKVNVLARDIAHKEVNGVPLYKLLGYEGHGVNGKPVALHHLILPGLGKPPAISEGYDENLKYDYLIKTKMSKSKPETSIYIHDPPEVVEKKIRKAFCPPKSKIEINIKTPDKKGKLIERTITIENPILTYVREIVFRALGKFELEAKGWSETYWSFDDLVRDYDNNKIHPLDLKMSLARHINEIMDPVRKYFESGLGRKYYEKIKEVKITR